MLRIVIENILLFLAPAALYLGYELLVRQTVATPRQVLDQAPLVMLFASGLGLIVLTLFFFSAKTEGLPGQSYEPPSYKDGKIIPGRVK
jgi:Family of unknown function (DUF6111)